jgi:Secretion system C-terminal sorting domain
MEVFMKRFSSFSVFVNILLCVSVCSSIAYSQRQSLFCDNFNRSDGALTSPWIKNHTDLLYINSQKVIGSSGYGLYFYQADTAKIACFTLTFNFSNDADGRFQLFLMDSTDGYIAKLSNTGCKLTTAIKESVLVNIGYSFLSSTSYKMQLQSNGNDSSISFIVLDMVGNVLSSTNVLSLHSTSNFSLPISCNTIGIGFDNKSDTSKYIDDVLFERLLTVSTGVDHHGSAQMPTVSSLLQNYPNPFNPSTVISYQVASLGKVNLKVFDLLGREVAMLVNEVKSIGNYELTFNAANLPSGVYFYRLQVGSFTETKRLVLLK